MEIRGEGRKGCEGRENPGRKREGGMGMYDMYKARQSALRSEFGNTAYLLSVMLTPRKPDRGRHISSTNRLLSTTHLVSGKVVK